MIQVIQGQKVARKKDQILTDKITRMRKKGGEQYTARLANKLGLPYADLNITPLSTEDIFLIPENIAHDLNVICFHKSGRKLHFGTSKPEDKRLLKHIENLEQNQGVTVLLTVISGASLQKGLNIYKNVLITDKLDTMRLSLGSADLKAFEASTGKLLKLSKDIESLSTTEILSIILTGAIALEASDIHIEPQTDHVRLRYRIDGLLKDVVHIPLANLPTIVSRIKLMSSMKINIRGEAQDGRFSFDIEEQAQDNTTSRKKVDIRTSIIPGKKSENIVMRVLGGDMTTSIESLGLRGKAHKDLMGALGKTDGLILTTGPTGSGKTTTLYSILKHLTNEQNKIITIENPIEYQIEGIVQTEATHDQDFSFANALRSIVRQDPDIILVGEIRDEETAEVALGAALTGHLVLSTLHTNGAIGTIARLTEMGIRPTLIPSASDIFLAQRLVRKLCKHCKQTYEPAQEVAETLMKMISLISPKAEIETPKTITTLYRPVGCVKCGDSGYKGRIGIFEALTIGDKLEEMILEMHGEAELTKQAIEEGFVTMTQDGILKALEGSTSIDEVWRVTSESGMIQDLYDSLMSQTLTKRLTISQQHTINASQKANSISEMQTTIAQATSSNVLPQIIGYATHLRASDIHIEPNDKDVQIRLRIDGTLQTIASIELTSFQQILGEIKVLANIPTTARQGVTDSRFGIFYEGLDETKEATADVRVSIIVGGFGETVVMRLLTSDAIHTDISELGITPYNQERIMQQVRKPHGMILNTGPTGSGKTTTLYSILQMIATDAIKVITIEDPIEYQIPGILQTQVNTEKGYTFANALTSLLRQDPDVIFLGEIRDTETASTATDAAQTGHLVLSTLHTNSAIATLSRLENLNLSRDDITASLNAIIAQRLVRKLCSCKQNRELTQEEQTIITSFLDRVASNPKVTIPKITEGTTYTPGSCAKCNGLGYKGRIALSEVLVLNDAIVSAIMRGALASDIESVAKETGMITIEEDGLLKALSGETTLEEVRRVTML